MQEIWMYMGNTKMDLKSVGVWTGLNWFSKRSNARLWYWWFESPSSCYNWVSQFIRWL